MDPGLQARARALKALILRSRSARSGGEAEGSVRAGVHTGSGAWGDLISRSPRYGSYYFLGALSLVLALVVYIQFFMIGKMRDEARTASEQRAFFYRLFADTSITQSRDLDFILKTLTNPRFPVILTDQQGGDVLQWNVPGIKYPDTTVATAERLRRMAADYDRHNDPIGFEVPMVGWRVLHYGDSPLIRRLSYLPFVTVGAVALLVTVGYLGYRNIRDSQQRSLLAGMAKETAHQLGTPLSSLYGWLELMKAEKASPGSGADEGDSRLAERAIGEMERDLGRLNKVVSRFSHIGSAPELRPEGLNEVIAETAAYLRDRVPHFGREIQIVETYGSLPPISIDRELFSWAIENLMKNAIDAIEHPKGVIQVVTRRWDESSVEVLVGDNGKGIDPRHHNLVFEPGYSTKKRGWGLGLTVVKRIIEDYHDGRVGIRDSAQGIGTTFQILLPMAEGPPPDSDASSKA